MKRLGKGKRTLSLHGSPIRYEALKVQAEKPIFLTDIAALAFQLYSVDKQRTAALDPGSKVRVQPAYGRLTEPSYVYPGRVGSRFRYSSLSLRSGRSVISLARSITICRGQACNLSLDYPRMSEIEI